MKKLPSGAKAQSSCGFHGTAEQLAEKVFFRRPEEKPVAKATLNR
jgi:hypothetical protein